MPFSPEQSLLTVQVPALHTIDTSSVENLFGMWSLFSKTSHAMEDGKRLENLSWRLWNRETFCCAPQYPSSRTSRLRHRGLSTVTTDSTCTIATSGPTTNTTTTTTTTTTATNTATTTNIPVPELSSSLDSISSGDDIVDDDQSLVDSASISSSDDASVSTRVPRARPELRRHLSTVDENRACEKHITPIDLQKIVISIKETQTIDLAERSIPSMHIRSVPIVTETAAPTAATAAPSPPPPRQQPSSSSQTTLLESSASTLATQGSKSSQVIDSEDSSSTDMSTHSIIRGFVAGGAPSSYRSQTHLPVAAPTPILRSSAHHHNPPAKKKGAMFTIGTSSGEDESSLDSHMRIPSMPKSELSESLRRDQSAILKKTTSFKDQVAHGGRVPVFRSTISETDDDDDDDEEEVSESAIDDDDDSSEWEDSDDNNSGPSSMDGTLFQRVDSRPNLTSRRSLLTTLMHEPDRAKALATAAARSTPAMRRSRVTSPNGPSLANTPETSVDMTLQQTGSRPQPIIMTTSNTHQQLAFSPRTTRRNMLSTELTESLRKNLLWERQHKSTGNLAALKRRHTAQDMKNLKEHPQATYPTKTGTNMSFTNDYFNAGLGEYHARGW